MPINWKLRNNEPLLKRNEKEGIANIIWIKIEIMKTRWWEWFQRLKNETTAQWKIIMKKITSGESKGI